MTAAEFTPGVEGIFYDLPEDVYRSAPGEAQSDLKKILRSPAHYKAAKEEPRQETEAMIFGTLLHRAVLEPEKLEGSYVVRPAGMKFTTTEGKAWKSVQTLPIIDSDAERCLKLATQKTENCVLFTKDESSPEIRLGKFLEKGKHEVSVFRRHEPTGLLLKGRLDCLVEDNAGKRYILDVKTTDNAQLFAFQNKIADFGYDFQAAFYKDLIDADYFFFAAVEKTIPCSVAPYQLDNLSIDAGRLEYQQALRLLAKCLERDEWPDYEGGLRTISSPEWKKRRVA